MTRKKSVRGNLSKSLYLRGLQCHKSLWFHKYDPALKSERSANQEALFNEGKKIGALARNAFPGGRHIDREAETWPHRLKLTQDCVDQNCPVIFEATFNFNNVLVMVDILVKTTLGWGIIEVKSNTSLKPVHLHDLSVQDYVLSSKGLHVNSVKVMHINYDYQFKRQLNLKQLFKKVIVTNKVKKRAALVGENIDQMRAVLKINEPPPISIGTHCKRPYVCDFYDYCWKGVPKKSIFNVATLSSKKKFGLYQKGILKAKDIPSHVLNSHQKAQIKADYSKEIHVKKKLLRDFLAQIRYPLYFIDFEGFQSAIPLYPHTHPFEQVPFQFSVHYQLEKGGTLFHDSFLAEEGTDPRPALIKALIKVVPPEGCLVAYNCSFEKMLIQRLATLYKPYYDRLMGLQLQFIDLMIPFKNRMVYTSKMNGKFSLKYVLPALVPELSYKDLFIMNGETAFRQYLRLTDIDNDEEKKTIKQQLLNYCEMDTFAMVKILDVLNQLI